MSREARTEKTVADLRKCAQAVYLATEEVVAADIAAHLTWAAEEIERFQKLYEMAVRGRQEFRALVREMRERVEKIP